MRFAHDFFRSPLLNEYNAEANARWLFGLYEPTLRSLGIHSACLSEKPPAAAVPVLQLLEHAELPPCAEAWAKVHSGAIDLQEVYVQLKCCDYVIGFEMAPSLLRYLADNSIPFLDFTIDPVRFAEDLFLSVRTNDVKAYEQLHSRHITDDRLLPAVGLIRAQFERSLALHSPFWTEDSSGSSLFIGQSDVDASLVVNGVIARVTHHLDSVRARVHDTTQLIIKPHPYGAKQADVQDLHAEFPHSLFTSENVYSLLSSRKINEVITMSSSVATEAELFGKTTCRLITPDRDTIFADGELAASRCRVAWRDLDSNFWATVLLGQERGSSNNMPDVRRDELRRCLGDSWGYSELTKSLPTPLIKDDQVIEFTAGSAGCSLLTFGWHEPESWGVWSSGRLSTLLLAPETLDDCLIRLEVVILAPQVKVTVFARGAMTGMAIVEQSKDFVAKHELELHLVINPLISSRSVEIGFEIREATSPRSIGVSDDERKLGVGLRSIAFHCVP